MTIIQVVPSIGDESSGPSYSVPGLCCGLVENGCDVSLHFAGKTPARKFSFPVHAYPVKRFPHPRIGRSSEMLKGLKEACKEADIVHNNSFWMFPNVYPAMAKKGTKCKIVNAPRGTLAEWSLKHHWLQKKLFGWFGGQYVAMAATDMWHATCEKEYEEIRALGYRQPVAIVPIGMDLPEVEPRNTQNTLNDGRKRKRIVFFGRLHKVKAVDNLVLAWEKICSQSAPTSSVCSVDSVVQNWELVIAGPDGGVRRELEALVSDRKIPRVSFVGEINGDAKYRLLSAADIYVLPSLTENFGVTVAEALVSGTPVIASQGTPWQGLEREKCGRWVPIGVESLAAALDELMSMSEEERAAMGARGREWIRRDFSWKGIGTKMKAAYEWLLGQGEKPEWVVSR